MTKKESATTETSILLDKTPPEIRLMIFRLALRSTRGIVRKRPYRIRRDTRSFRPADTSLFLVNHAVSQEAQDAFYEVNTVRLNDAVPFIHLLEPVRRLEIAGELASRYCTRLSAVELDKILGTLLRLPKLKSITLMCNSFSEGKETVREFAMRALPVSEICCIGLGAFELFQTSSPTDTKPKIYLKSLEITPNLPRARSLALKYPNFDVADTRSSIAREFSVSTCRLAEGLKWYHKWRTVQSNPDALEYHEHYMVHVMAEFLKLSAEVCIQWKHNLLPEDVRLEDLTVEEHGAEVVEWATNFMALNLLHWRSPGM